MKNPLVIIALIVLLSCIVTAENVDIEITPKTPDVFPGGNAEYTLKVENLMNENIAFSVKSIDLNWMLEQDLEKYTVEKRKTKYVDLVFKPLGELGPKSYGVNLIVWNDDFRIEKILPVNVVDYEGLVSVLFNSVPSIDPRKGTLIKLGISNKYHIDLDGLEVELLSESFIEKKTIDLKSEENADLEFSVDLHPQLLEGEFPVRVKISWDGHLVYDNFFDLNIASIRNVKEIVSFEEGILFTAVNVKRINEGNSIDDKDFAVEFSLLEKIFTSFEPDPDVVNKVDGRYNVVWYQNLKPGDEFSARYETNYRKPLLIVFSVAVLFVFGYYFLKRSLKIHKKVTVIRKGNEVVLKVNVVLKNAGSTSINFLTLVDRVPGAVKSPSFGTVKPSKVNKAVNLLSIVWNIKSLGKGEERVYSYSVPVKLHKDGILLPSAYVRYSEKGKRMMNTSNSLSVGR